jgi:hypothetical protein
LITKIASNVKRKLISSYFAEIFDKTLTKLKFEVPLHELHNAKEHKKFPSKFRIALKSLIHEFLRDQNELFE